MQYNVRQQLTRITQSGKMDMEYIFHDPANNDFVNNGRVRKTKDHLSGEEVTYGYDELNRLISAATTSNDWGLAWVFDGFGNRLQQNVTKGSAPALSVTVDGTRNRITSSGFAFDDHGNMTARPGQTLSYDPAHRLEQVVDGSSGTTQFAYDSANKRIWKKNGSAEEFYFYGAQGEVLGAYKLVPDNQSPSTLRFQRLWTNEYFAGRMIK